MFLTVGTLSAAIGASSAAKPVESQKTTVGQLQAILSASQGKTDAEIAQQLATVTLAERLSATRLTQFSANLNGARSREALLLLADQSVFLDLPVDEIADKPVPDPAATRQMLVQIVNYVNTTLRQLPNFIAARETTAFEDRPKEDSLEATGVVSYSYLPLHFVGKSNATVTYRDHAEQIDDRQKKSPAKGQNIGGLVTSGEFGPILTTVLADALKGKITWARWELGPEGTEAVFHYAVPQDKSHYRVKFCCIVNGFASDGQPEMHVFDELAGYHGEIAFNPLNGSIFRITVEAEMPPQGLVPNAGIAVEYGSVDIGGKSYICPIRSISVLLAHINRPQGMFSSASYKGPAKTFLNDVTFSNYRRFGSESRILTGEAETPKQ